MAVYFAMLFGTIVRRITPQIWTPPLLGIAHHTWRHCCAPTWLHSGSLAGPWALQAKGDEALLDCVIECGCVFEWGQVYKRYFWASSARPRWCSWRPGTSASAVLYLVSSLRLELASPAFIMSRGFHTGDPTNKETKTGQIKQKSIYVCMSRY